MYGINEYVPLMCFSNFSFLEGASHPDELVTEAHRLGMTAIALTDRDGLYGIVKAHVAARALGIQLIVGSSITLEDTNRILLLVKDHTGYANLCRIISIGRRDVPKGRCRVSWDTLFAHTEGIICLAGNHLFSKCDPSVTNRIAGRLKRHFGSDLFLALSRHDHPSDPGNIRQLQHCATHLNIPCAAVMEVLYHARSRRPLQDILTCIHHGVTIQDARGITRPNDSHYLHSPTEFAMRFADMPDAIANTVRIAQRCTFSLDDIDYRYPAETTDRGDSSMQRLEKLTFDGASVRYGNPIPVEVHQQIDTELALIDQLDYPGYFLTMYDIVQFCRTNDILCQGRGSAANSAVCFCLGITAVDPVKMALLFERFISKERSEPPDIDLDIEHQRREEVIQFVYRKYGRDRAAMVAVVIRYRPKSAIRDVGKALGIPEETIHRLSKQLPNYGQLTEDGLIEEGIPVRPPLYDHLWRLTKTLLDFPRHLSIHPGGFILGKHPIHTLVPVENGTMPGRTVIQWDKYDVEAMKLFKVDLLGLGALTQLHLCFDLIAKTRNIHLNLASLPPDDTETFDMISTGDTIGVFQLESRAQMAMLPRLRPRHFYDLVIEISLVRPGPISGQMVHPYLARRNNEAPVTYPHPLLEPVLQKTLGVPLFQEQVMRIAIIAADYSPGEADQLRRDMAAWRHTGHMERHRKKLVERMKNKGVPEAFAMRIFEQVRGFGEYGFPESHAASFALISYATAYLRRHYMDAFTCALMNALPMGFYALSTLVQDARRKGCTVLPVDIHKSEWYCTLPCSNTIRMGLRHVNGVGKRDFDSIAQARDRAPFTSITTVRRRCHLKANVMDALSRAGAFACLMPNRREALWQSMGTRLSDADELYLPSCDDRGTFSSLDPLETVLWDMAAAGHSTHGHPLAHLRRQLNRQKLPTAARVNSLAHDTVVRYVGMVICRQRPATASGVVFMTLEDESGFVNLVCWRQVFERYAILARTASVLGVTGSVQRHDGVTHLIADKLWHPDLSRHPGTIASRDFK